MIVQIFFQNNFLHKLSKTSYVLSIENRLVCITFMYECMINIRLYFHTHNDHKKSITIVIQEILLFIIN